MVFRCISRRCTCWQSSDDILCMLHGSHMPPNTCSGWSPSLPTGYLHKLSSPTRSFSRSYLGSPDWSLSFIRFVWQHQQRSTLSSSHTPYMQHVQHMQHSCNLTPPARLRCTGTSNWDTAASRTFTIAATSISGIVLLNLDTGPHWLNIETGRHQFIARQDETCQMCNH